MQDNFLIHQDHFVKIKFCSLIPDLSSELIINTLIMSPEQRYTIIVLVHIFYAHINAHHLYIINTSIVKYFFLF